MVRWLAPVCVVFAVSLEPRGVSASLAADATTTLQGNYYGQAPYLISPEMGLGKYVNTAYAQGCDVACASDAGFAGANSLLPFAVVLTLVRSFFLCVPPDAASVAASADAVVLVVGIDQTVESEGHDRTAITLPGLQNQLIQAIVGNATGPVVVVIMAGGPLDVSVPKNLPGVHAMLWCGYPGQSGGQAIADVIFGTYPPGHLPLAVCICCSYPLSD
jgi:xylan 1,4-beta-xylosidase